MNTSPLAFNSLNWMTWLLIPSTYLPFKYQLHQNRPGIFFIVCSPASHNAWKTLSEWVNEWMNGMEWRACLLAPTMWWILTSDTNLQSHFYPEVWSWRLVGRWLSPHTPWAARSSSTIHIPPGWEKKNTCVSSFSFPGDFCHSLWLILSRLDSFGFFSCAVEPQSL